jgi:hopanoid biosynthesis associated protein HpnK
VNEAVETAHAKGVLTAASLMVAAPSAADAVARARKLPNLRVGLHLVVVDGPPTLPPARIPHLVGQDGMLRRDLTALAFTLAGSRTARAELRAEIEAQFEAFARTGLPLDHVNAHRHYHLNPIVGAMLLDVGARHGMKGLRAPIEDAALLRRLEPGKRPTRGVAETLCGRLLLAGARRRGVRTPDQVYGLRWSGAMRAERLEGLVGALPSGFVEIYLHPATADVFPGSAEGYAYRAELEALLDQATAETLRRSSHKPGGYLDALASA